ncbi:unnamed protein product [Scytosiphon promiscuus]
MKEAYATVSLTIRCLVSGEGDEFERLKNQAVLRSVLQRRPVSRGFALSALARRLQEGAAAGKRPGPQEGEEPAGTSTAAPTGATAPHAGICLALEVVLESSYHPSTPQTVAPVLDALGDERLEALLRPPGGASPLLPWTARLCLLHASLADGKAKGRRWRSLSTVADSACSLALQDITTAGGSSGSSASANTRSNGKSPARLPTAKATSTREADMNGPFHPAFMAQVCEGLAKIGAMGVGSTPGNGFLCDFSGVVPGVVRGGPSTSRSADPLPGGQAAGSFRPKLQALRDALLSAAGSEGRAKEQRMPMRVAMVGDVDLEELEVHPEAVSRALERGRCGEAFILAVKAALEANLVATGGSKAAGQTAPSTGGRKGAVKLRQALEVCFFGAGIPGGRGLLDVVVTGTGEIGPMARSSSAVPEAVTRVTRSPEATPAPHHTRRAFAFMRGLVEDGVRIRDLVLALVGMHQERRLLERPLAGPASAWWTGAQAVAAVQSTCDFRRRMVVVVLGTFIEWLADTPWVWGATEGMEGEDWEGDFAAAASAIPLAFPGPLADAGSGTCAPPLFGRFHTTVQVPGQSKLDVGAGDLTRNPLGGTGGVDPAGVLDRLVGGVAAAMEHADADKVGWVDVLRHLAAAATASTASLKAYALTCVEKSAALGGQAPFRAAGKRRFSQVGGKELWDLLEGACLPNEEALAVKESPCSVLVRTAAAAVTASRRISQSSMISPGLLGSGPIRVVIDMIGAAKGRATASDVLSGLLDTRGEEGPALAADMFAAFTAAATVTSGRTEGGDEGGALRSRVVAWLSDALSVALQSVQSPPSDVHGVIASTALARVLIGRVPHEAKPVLLAVEEAAERAAACTRKRRHDSRTGSRESLDGDAAAAGSSPLATLLKVARAAWQSHLLPLPVPASLPPQPEKRFEIGEGTADAGTVPADDSPETSTAERGERGQTGTSAAATTAGLLLDSFVRSPAAVRRSIREATQQRGSNNELRVVLRALRLALCSASSRVGSTAGPRTIRNDTLKSEKAPPLSEVVGSRKAPACLLVGYLVESGVSGWEETKAAMIPPPPQLVEAAEGPSGEEGADGVPHCDDSRQPPLTALRLEMWLRPLLHDAAVPGFDAGEDIEKAFPDVFRTARTLARAIAKHASNLITRGSQGIGPPLMDGYYSQSAGGFGGVEVTRPVSFLPYDTGPTVGASRQGGAAEGRLEAPRRALAERLQRSPAAPALASWVSSIAKTAKQFRRWLPWQPFADELRELLSARQRLVPEQQAGGDGGAEMEGKTLAAEAAVFAVCELVLAWEEAGQEIIASVFRPAFCSKALDAAGVPAPTDARPPIWLEVFRCLVNEGECDLSDWMSSQVEGSGYQGPLSVAAAAAVWIGGDGAGAGQSGKRSTREAWMRWYDAVLRPLIPLADTDFGNWLILSNVAGKSACRGVQVRTGAGGAAPPTVVQSKEWEKWGRSPLQAAWKIPAGCAENGQGFVHPDAGVAPPHAVVLPPFASWLRVVLRGEAACPEGVLKAYLRRMAREVFLPCQFGGASSEMARQWLGVLIEAEAAAERKRKRAAAVATGAAESNDRHVKTESWSGNEAGATTVRQTVVKAFFREELLRFGSGEAAAAAAVGGPLTWLWPLEAVVAACGKAGSFGGGGVLARRRRRGSVGERLQAVAAPAPIVLDGPPSALARVLGTVPHDLLCGSRRFDRGGGQPPPAPATLCAFAGRVVDLTARALATPPCRHWSVARRLLLGLGLLYHALATPPRSARNGEPQKSPGAIARARAVETSGLGARARGEDAAAHAAAQATVLSAIEGLVGIALGLVSGSGAGRVYGSSARVEGGHRGGPALLSSACLSLQPLEAGTCVGADSLAEALRGAGAWRAAAAFFGQRKDLQAALSTQDPLPAQAAPVVKTSPPLSQPPLSPQADLPPQCHLQPSPGAIPAMEVDQPVGGGQANGQSSADSPAAEGAVDGEPPSSSGGDELVVSAPHAPSWGVPSVPKKARLSTKSAEGAPPPYSPRRVLPARSSKRLHSSS